jgi:glycine hydroxymethyltransferase
LDKGVFPGAIGSNHFNTMAAKVWSFKYAMSDEFKKIMQQIVVNAKTLAEALKAHGFRLVTGSTDNHLLLVDLRSKNITGKVFQEALDTVGITINKNQIPFDPESPFVTSGARIGLTSITQRGLKAKEIKIIADIMNRVAEHPTDKKVLDNCRQEAEALISQFPLYPENQFFED